MQKYGEPTNDSNYDGSCTLPRFRFGTFKTFNSLIFVGLSVHTSTELKIIWMEAVVV